MDITINKLKEYENSKFRIFIVEKVLCVLRKRSQKDYNFFMKLYFSKNL